MAFEVSSFPTESLHKFMAIGGLAVVIASFIGLVVTANELNLIDINLKNQINIYQIKADRITELVKKNVPSMQSRRNKNLELDLNSKQIKKKSTAELKRAQIELEGAIKEGENNLTLLAGYDEKLYELDLIIAEILGREELLEYRQKQLYILWAVGSIAVLIGSKFSRIGFKRWVIVQGYINDALRKEAQP